METKVADNRITSVKSGDRSAFEELLKSFEPLILSETSKLLAKFSEFSGDAEEFHQEGRLALYDAAMSYSENEKVTFGLYAKICVHNRLISYLRKLSAKKRRADRAARVAVTPAKNATDELIAAYEKGGELKKLINEQATEYERTVFALYMQRKTYAEIAEAVGKSTKSVDNAICRVKAKIRRYFS